MKKALVALLLICAAATAHASGQDNPALDRAKQVAAKYCPQSTNNYDQSAIDSSESLGMTSTVALGYRRAINPALRCIKAATGLRQAYLIAYTVDLMQGLADHVDAVQANDIRHSEDKLIEQALATKHLPSDLQALLEGLQNQE